MRTLVWLAASALALTTVSGVASAADGGGEEVEAEEGPELEDLNEGLGLNLFEGDLDADYGSVVAMYGVEVADDLVSAGIIDAPPDSERRALGLTTSTRLLWDDRGADGVVTVPLAYSSAFSSGQIQTMKNAAQELGDRVGVIRFVDRTTESSYIEFVDGNGCSSRIGRDTRGVRQVITLQSNGCVFKGTIQHEIYHALGVLHEQSRSDRDSFVTINLENIQENRENNFRRGSTKDLGVPYDYGSVMHYGRRAFSKNGLNTIDAPQAIGQRAQASASDVLQLQLLYGLAATPTPLPTPVPTPEPTPSPSLGPTAAPSNVEEETDAGTDAGTEEGTDSDDTIIVMAGGGGALVLVLGMSALFVRSRRWRKGAYPTAKVARSSKATAGNAPYAVATNNPMGPNGYAYSDQTYGYP